jgi:peptide/nickel transport system permease protein
MTARALASRVAQAATTILIVLVVDFALFRVLPGDPARMLLGERAQQVSPAALAAMRAKLGLDAPVFPDQFVAYVGNLVHGEFGYSFLHSGRLVSDVVGERLLPTLLLVGLGLGLGIFAGVLLGAGAGWRRGRLADVIGVNAALVVSSLPMFWLGMLLVIAFSSLLHLFPSGGMLTPGAPHPDAIAFATDLGRHLVLPVASFALVQVGVFALLVRTSLADVRSADHIRTARSIGLRERRVLWRHAMPTVMLPLVTVIAVSLGSMVAGSVTVETVFSWPGIGLLTSEALASRDYPVLQAIFLLVSVSVILANLAADLLYAFLDPRTREQSSQ